MPIYHETSIVIVNWNGLRYLPACLGSLEAQTYRDFETIVVDNGSTDGSAQYIRKRCPDVRLIPLSTNVGFATGNNVGIADARGEFVVTLNNDTEVDPGWLALMVGAAQGRPGVGMVASTMLFAHRPDLIASAGIQVGRDGVAIDRLIMAPVARHSLSQPVEVFGPSAGAALYRRTMLDDIGSFDADYFAYLEDVDLAFRGRLRNWRCVWETRARVMHVYSATAGQDSPLKRYLMARNRLWTILKDFPARVLLRCLPSMLVYDGLALAHALAHGTSSSVRGRLRPMLDLPTLLSKRKAIQSRRLAREADVWQLLTPVSSALTSASLQRRLNRLLLERGPATGPQMTGEEMGRR